MLTPFGYETESMPPLVTADRFNEQTGYQYAADPRLEPALGAVSGLVRMACRWHIAPTLACTYVTGGGGKLIQLPALAVTAVDGVTENGATLAPGQFEWRREGLLRRTQFRAWAPGWNSVSVDYKSGFDQVPAEIAEIVVSRVLGELSMPLGVKSESAGGVSITYGDYGYTAGLSAIEAMALAPYALPTEA